MFIKYRYYLCDFYVFNVVWFYLYNFVCMGSIYYVLFFFVVVYYGLAYAIRIRVFVYLFFHVSYFSE